MSQQFWPYGFKVQIFGLPLHGAYQQCLTNNGSLILTSNCSVTRVGTPNPIPSQTFTLDFNNHIIASNGMCFDQGNFTGGLYLSTCNSGTLNSQSFFPGAVSTAYYYQPWASGLLGYGDLCINTTGNYWQPSYVNTATCNARSPNQAWEMVIVSN